MVLKPDSHLQMGKLVEVVGKVAELDGGSVCIYYTFMCIYVVCVVKKYLSVDNLHLFHSNFIHS